MSISSTLFGSILFEYSFDSNGVCGGLGGRGKVISFSLEFIK